MRNSGNKCEGRAIPLVSSASDGRHFQIIRQIEELLGMHPGMQIYLADICAATGVSERTLENCCSTILGMGPIRYLKLLRMDRARKALLGADWDTTSVTRIACEHGFWELGRFAVEYRKLYGESPSETLRKTPPDPAATG